MQEPQQYRDLVVRSEFGSAGTQVDLLTNVYTLLRINDDTAFFQYSVEVKELKDEAAAGGGRGRGMFFNVFFRARLVLLLTTDMVSARHCLPFHLKSSEIERPGQ